MDDGLDIPEFLRRPPLSEAEREKLHRRMLKWRPSSIFAADDGRKIERDREGRPLPASLDDAGRALLRQIEKADTAKQKADDKERFRILAAQRAEKAAIKKAAKEAKR